MTDSTGSFVLDLATLSKALTRLGEVAGTGAWTANSDSAHHLLQERFLGWYELNRSGVEKLSDIKTEASDDADVLNKFLIENRFPGMFRPLSPGGVGAAAILDMLVRWAVEASKTVMTTFDMTQGYKWTDYGAFEIPRSGFEIFDVPGKDEKLVRLSTKEGASVWLMISGRPGHGLDLVDLAVNALATRRQADSRQFSSVIVPSLEIDTQADLSWMLRVYADAEGGPHIIEQAFQLFKLRMNEEGARVRVATGLATERGMSGPEPLRLDRPFAGWFTQPDSEIPVAAFYAARDSWQTSNGRLGDL